MGAPGPAVVVVGHDASRTGAPRVLLAALRWASTNRPGGVAGVVLLRGGPLEREYAAAAPTRVAGAATRAASLAGAASGQLGGRGAGLAGRALGRWVARGTATAEVVVANTLAAAPAVVAAARPGQRVVCHVHELDGVADRVLPRGPGRDRVLARTDRFVATGDAVADLLVRRWGVPPGRVLVVDAFIDDPEVAPAAVDAARGDVGAGAGEPLLVAAGVAGPRKGSDVFVDLAVAVAGAVPDLRAAWVGADVATPAGAELAADAAGARAVGPGRPAAGGPCVVVPPLPDARPHLAAADVHVSAAREDPFPLTVLEAAALGTAVVGFDAGGLGPLVRASGAAAGPPPAVPVGDVLGLADAAASLLRDAGRRAEAAAALGDHVRSHHLTPVLAPRWWEACTSW